jgi:hypothetical protein
MFLSADRVDRIRWSGAHAPHPIDPNEEGFAERSGDERNQPFRALEAGLPLYLLIQLEARIPGHPEIVGSDGSCLLMANEARAFEVDAFALE